MSDELRDPPVVWLRFGYEESPRIVTEFACDEDRARMVCWIERACGGEYLNLLNRAAEFATRTGSAT